MKRLLSLLLVLVLFASIMSITSLNTYAITTVIEGNRNYDIDFTGDAGETKTFTFIMPENSYFYYTVTPIKLLEDGEIKEPDDWSLMNTKMKVNYKLYEDTDDIDYGEIFRSGSYSFKKGTKVQILLYDEDNGESTLFHRLRVVVKKTKNFEKENNNSKKKATNIQVGKTYTGISQQRDKDWWKFIAPKSGKFRIFGVEVNEGKIQAVKTYKNNKLISSATIESNEGYKILFNGYLKKGQKIYILLDDGSKDEFYKLKVKKVS